MRSERPSVGATLRREPTDRPPVDLWLTPEVLADLKSYTGQEDELAVYSSLGVDKIVWVFPGYDSAQFDPNHSEGIGPWVSHFEIYCHMRGMENALMDVVAEPDFLDAALDRIEEVQTRLLDRFLREAGDLIDMVFISDDLGTQESQLLSVPAFEAHLKPRIRRWCDLIHRHGKKVLFHTDGASRSFLPHLAQCGVDILNPIQHVCPGMETAALKRDFGEMFIFHGGIENQQVLPRGTASEVRDEVRRCMETLGRNGGYIVCSCHNIQAGTPTANVLAMIEAVREAAR